jgi:hypothetical protein
MAGSPVNQGLHFFKQVSYLWETPQLISSIKAYATLNHVRLGRIAASNLQI